MGWLGMMQPQLDQILMRLNSIDSKLQILKEAQVSTLRIITTLNQNVVTGVELRELLQPIVTALGTLIQNAQLEENQLEQILKLLVPQPAVGIEATVSLP